MAVIADPRRIQTGPPQMGAARAPGIRQNPAVRGMGTPTTTMRPAVQRPSPLDRAQTNQVQVQTQALKPTVAPGANAPLTQQAYEQQAMAKLNAGLGSKQGEVDHTRNVALEGLKNQQAQLMQTGQQKHETGVIGQEQGFKGKQAELERAQQAAILGQQQQFQGQESAAQRAQQAALQAGQQQWQTGESQAERAARLAEMEKSQVFEGGQAGLNRAQQLAMQSGEFDFQRGESNLERQNRIAMQNTSGEQAIAQMNRQGQLQGESDIRRSGIADATFDKRWGLINSLPPIDGPAGGPQAQGMPSGPSGGAPPPPGAGGPMAQGGPTAQAASDIPPEEAGARNAAFARAKEQSGRTALSALQGLKDQFAGSGLTGSSMEAGAIGNVVGGAAGGVNEFTRDQMIMDLERSGKLADRNYAGNLQKRGQDIGYRQSLLGLMNSGMPSIY